MTKNKADSLLKNIPKTTDVSDPKPAGSKVAADRTATESLAISRITESVSDLRRDLLEITAKLKDGLAGTKRDFNRETQRMSDADAARDRQTQVIIKRVDALEADSRRLFENLNLNDQKLSQTTMRADSAVYATETHSAELIALRSSLELVKDDLGKLTQSVDRFSKQSLSIRWISLLATLGLISVFGIYRVVSLPDVSHVERVQATQEAAINDIIQHLNNQ